jgi:hypothetical protein
LSAPAGRSLPPRILEPILIVAEMIDRRRRHIHPIRPAGVLGVEHGRYHGPPTTLRDGTVVPDGAPILLLHLLNVRLRDHLAAHDRPAAWREAQGDFRALAAWWRRQPPGSRPLALHSATLHVALARRMGMEILPRRRTLRARVDDWFMRWLMVRYGLDPTGRGRMRRGRHALESGLAWFSMAELAARY